MRLKYARWIAKIILLASGFTLLLVGLFAYSLGIDHNADWGKGRVVLVAAGAGFILCGLAFHFHRQVRAGWQAVSRWRAALGISFPFAGSLARPARAAQRALAAAGALPPLAWLRATPRRREAFACGCGVAVVLGLYLWYITGGTPAHWTGYSAYFDRLANAFRSGQLSLQEKPPEALVALENPYLYQNRAGLDYLWDASLYQGKYYYYWGPVPALVILVVKSVANVRVEDQYLVFAFCGGLVLVSALLLAYLRRQFFASAPPWTLFPLVVFSGMVMPVFWLVNHPNVYEAAVSGGQFFLILGLYAAVRAAGQAARRPVVPAAWLGLAGFAWGAAVNCRISLAPAVIFFTALFGWLVLRRLGTFGRVGPGLAWLGIPLLLWAAGLGWYNAARFGSLVETGHRYQLTGAALPPDYRDVTSLAYMLPNLYNYIFRMPALRPGSPFTISVPYVAEGMWPFFIRLPEHYYYSEQVASILATAPGVLLAFLPVLQWVNRGWLWLNEKAPPGLEDEDPPAWLWWACAGGGLALVIPLLVFISSSMRYLADAVPLLTIASAVGLWWGLRFLRFRPRLRAGLGLAAAALILFSVYASLVVVFHTNDMRFEVINPELYFRLHALLR